MNPDVNPDVNITLSAQNGHDAEDTQQASSNSRAERHNNGADVAIASTNKETTEESSCIVTERCTEWLGRDMAFSTTGLSTMNYF